MAILERWGNPARDYYSWRAFPGWGWDRLALSDTKLSDTKLGDTKDKIQIQRPPSFWIVLKKYALYEPANNESAYGPNCCPGSLFRQF